MKSLITATFGLCALLVILLAWGCGPPGPNANSNQSQNTNTAANANSADAELLSDDGTCDEVKPGIGRDEVYKKLKERIEESSLADQYADKEFKFDVVVPSDNGANSLYLLIEGKVAGKHKNNRDQFEVLVKIIKSFLKEKCVMRVMFVPDGTLPLKKGVALTDDLGGEWTACDYPNVPCPGGECLPPGTCPNPPSANVNPNVNSNSRPNLSANANLR